MASRLARVPIRLRVTLAFAASTAVVLVALAFFLHARLSDQLDDTVRSNLRQRAGDLVAIAREPSLPASLGHSGLVERGDDLAQILDADGRVVAGAPGFERAPLLSAAERERARRRTVSVERAGQGDDGRVALLAAPAGSRIVVVGAFLEDRNESLAKLDALLALGVPIALLLASAAGYAVAGTALRPIDRMRSRADDLGERWPIERLPVPDADDEVRRLAVTLNHMLDRLEAAIGRERAFVADASHELRAPLARMRTELELAARGERTTEDLEDAVRSALEETERLARLAEDLLVLARADQGRLPLRTEPVSVREMLRDGARRADVRADVHIDAEDGLVVDADPLRLEQAVVNLLDNARRHGGEPIEAYARRDSSGTVRLGVRDRGPGFTNETREVAFERFTRGDASRGSDGGAGLGLAIVAAIAAAHGGRAGIDTSPGEGADVWLRLPVVQGPVNGLAAAGPPLGDNRDAVAAPYPPR